MDKADFAHLIERAHTLGLSNVSTWSTTHLDDSLLGVSIPEWFHQDEMARP